MQAVPLLDPSPYAVGIFPQFYNHGNTVSLKIREKILSLSGQDYTITDATNGAPVFKVSGTFFSLRGRKEFQDMQGNSLFELKNELMHIHTTYVAKRSDSGDQIFSVQGKIWTIHDEMSAKFQNQASGREEELIVRGDWLNRKAEIRLGRDGPVMASITRNFWTGREWLADVQTYYIHVAPGVDLSLMTALCICLDEVHNQG